MIEKNWRVPAGSLVVDTALVFALIWGGAKMEESLAQLERRVARFESLETLGQVEPRLRVLERRAEEMDEFKTEVRGSLNRIEEKLDKAIKR